jgi:prefoldin subunit 5
VKRRNSAGAVFVLILAIAFLRPARPETASPSLSQLATDLNGLQARVAALEGQVSGLQSTVGAQASQITTLQATVSTQAAQIGSLQSAVSGLQSSEADLQNKLQFVTVEGTEMFITGANLNIRNGGGWTADTNGLGNLIVGYNENVNASDSQQPRGGSHNLVVGPYHGYSSFGGLVAGTQNLIGAPHASITGGYLNKATNFGSSVSGGTDNTAFGIYTSVSGGQNNTASGKWSSISGGQQNAAGGRWSSVNGGYGNTANAFFASVSGGELNLANGERSTISGGYAITQSAVQGWAGGAFRTP